MTDPGMGLDLPPLRIPKTSGDLAPGLTVPIRTSTLPEGVDDTETHTASFRCLTSPADAAATGDLPERRNPYGGGMLGGHGRRRGRARRRQALGAVARHHDGGADQPDGVSPVQVGDSGPGIGTLRTRWPGGHQLWLHISQM